MQAFDKVEFDARLALVRRQMRIADLDLLWITNPANIYYLSGYNAWSFYVHQGLLVSLDGEMDWIGRGIDVSAAVLTTSLPKSRIHGYPDKYITTDKHPMEFVAEKISSAYKSGRLGVELDSHYFTAAAFENLRKGLPSFDLVDADNLVNWIRTIKSDNEIKYLREAAELTDIAMNRAIEMIEPGVRHCDVAAEIFKNLIGGHPQFAGDMPDYQTLPKGKGTAAPHLTWTDEPFKVGESCTLELGANRFRYHAPLARTAIVGAPEKSYLELAAHVEEGLEAALAIVRPGALCNEVEGAWRRVIEAWGIKKDSRIGYSVGIGFPPDWGDGTASLAQDDTTPLQKNMTFHLMLGMWRDDFGYELSETFVVTDDACECLSKVPRKLFVKDV